MKASEAQHILSRLYTDQAYRKAFLAGKDAFYEMQQITDPEIRAFLNALKTEQLEFFAKGLYAKKYHEAMHQIPGTAFLLKDRIGKLFSAFSQAPRTYGTHKHHEEALAFIAFIRNEKTISPEARAILKFEEVLLLNFIQPKAWRICLLHYDAPSFLRSLQGREQAILHKKRLLVVFRKGRLFKII